MLVSLSISVDVDIYVDIRLRMEDVLFIYLEQIVSFVQYILKYKLAQVILWELKPENGKFHR